MFNLIVGFTGGVADASRMLEYTDDAVRRYITPEGRVDPARLLNLPTLVMPEVGDVEAGQVARIGRLNHLTPTGNTFRYQFTSLREIQTEQVEASASELGITGWELQRHHWAVKEADLHAVLFEQISPAVAPPDHRDHVARLLAGLPERDVDAFLGAFGVEATRQGWSERPHAVRRLEVTGLLRGLAPDQLGLLAAAVEEEVAESAVHDAAGRWRQPGSRPSYDASSAQSTAQPAVNAAGPIFVVHGHNHASLHLTVRVLERSTGREVIVLHEKANAGRTILEKFEDHAASAAFAVVLLTADDEGAVVGSASPQKRARQNVIFELGFFLGQLGRERVAVLVDEGVEKPSDISGLVYIALDSAGAWKSALGRELEAASITVNYARMP